jgi:hypothetical protein
MMLPSFLQIKPQTPVIDQTATFPKTVIVEVELSNVKIRVFIVE